MIQLNLLIKYKWFFTDIENKHIVTKGDTVQHKEQYSISYPLTYNRKKILEKNNEKKNLKKKRKNLCIYMYIYN